MKLNIKAFSIVCGLLWGLGLFLITWWIIAFDGVSEEPTLISSIYRGYTITAVGSLIGLIWAFADGLIGGAIFAWLYNLIAEKTQSAQA